MEEKRQNHEPTFTEGKEKFKILGRVRTQGLFCHPIERRAKIISNLIYQRPSFVLPSFHRKFLDSDDGDRIPVVKLRKDWAVRRWKDKRADAGQTLQLIPFLSRLNFGMKTPLNKN